MRERERDVEREGGDSLRPTSTFLDQQLYPFERIEVDIKFLFVYVL